MAGQQIGMRQRPRFNQHNIQNLNFQQQSQFQNPAGVGGPNDPNAIQGPGAQDPLMKKLEELLEKFMEAMQAQQKGGGACGGAPAGGGQKAGGAQKAGGNDPMFSLEELLKELRDLAQQNPQALQQFLQQNPQLAQMLGAQIGGMGGAALGGGMPAMGGGGMPAMDGGGPLL